MGYILLSLGILLFSIAFWFWRLSKEQRTGNLLSPPGPPGYIFHGAYYKRAHGSEYEGVVTLPKKVYIGDSLNVSVDLRPSLQNLLITKEAFSIQDKETGKLVTLQVEQDTDPETFLEVELQAAALKIDGEKKQRHVLSRLNVHKLSYRWNCYFPNSGNHAFALAFRVIYPSEVNDLWDLGAIQHTIKVVQLDHLTQRQVQILAAMAAIAGFIATIISIVTNTPTLLHLFGLH